jgi:hypothetical protein
MDWTEEGRRIGVTLDAFHAVVVVGSDPNATAHVALGIARTQAVHRRVALGDLLGEAEPLQSLVESDDPHGLVDSFLYGVSLTKVAHPVADAGELFIMPTGTGPVDYDELFAHPRWRRLIAGFREVGALLLIAAPANAARIHELVAATDGVVIVGDSVPVEVSVAQSLAWVRPRRGVVTPPAGSAVQTPWVAPTDEPVASGAAPASSSRRKTMAGAAGLLLAAAIAAAVYWFAARPQASTPRGAVPVAAARDSSVRAAAGDSAARARRDSIALDSAALLTRTTAESDSFPVLTPANASDSSAASAYGVLLQKTNTKSGAMLEMQGRFGRVPAGTYGVETPTRFFLLIGGAFPTRASADSLLGQLRARRVLAPGFGSVGLFPLAFLVDSAVPAATVRARLTRYAARGVPVYALRQSDGTARLYFGAYGTAEQAAYAVPQVKEAGMIPLLVYRTGRVF